MSDADEERRRNEAEIGWRIRKAPYPQLPRPAIGNRLSGLVRRAAWRIQDAWLVLIGKDDLE